MKKYFMFIPILVLITGTTVSAQSGEKKGSFDAEQLSDLQILVDAGMKISIKPSPSNSILYTYTFDGNSAAYEHYFENFDPVYEKSGGRAKLKIEYPRDIEENTEIRIQKHELAMLVPPSVMIDLATRYSQIEMVGFKRGLSIRNRSGSIKVDNIEQTVVVHNDYGSVTATNIRGDMMISNRSASVDLRGITGTVNVDANYSKINISKVDGSLIIQNRSGAVNAFDIQGDIIARGPYVEYELTNIDGGIQMDNQSSKVTVNNALFLTVEGNYVNIKAENISGGRGAGVEIRGRSAAVELIKIPTDIVINGQYLNVTLKDAGGSAQINNRSGTININGLEQNLFIEGEYLPIQIKDFRGDILRIANRSGSIAAETTGDVKEVGIDSEYGKVDLSLTKPFKGSVTFEAHYGSIDTNLSISNQTYRSENNDKTLSGMVGNGNSKIYIVNRNGDIRVNQK